MFARRGPQKLGGVGGHCWLQMEVGVHREGCTPILLATCALSCPSPSPTGSPARHPGLVPGPLALAPGPAAVGFLFLPVSLERAAASPPPSLLSSPFTQTHRLSPSVLGLREAEGLGRRWTLGCLPEPPTWHLDPRPLPVSCP